MSSMDEDQLRMDSEVLGASGLELDFLVQATLSNEVYYSIERSSLYYTVRLSGACAQQEELLQNLKLTSEQAQQIRSFPVESSLLADFLITHFHGKRISTGQEIDFFKQEDPTSWYLVKSETGFAIGWDGREAQSLAKQLAGKLIHLGPLHLAPLAETYLAQFCALEGDSCSFQKRNSHIIFENQDNVCRESFLDFWLRGLQSYWFCSISANEIATPNLRKVLYRQGVELFLEEVRTARKFWLSLGIPNELN